MAASIVNTAKAAKRGGADNFFFKKYLTSRKVEVRKVSESNYEPDNF
jgi:hypothetical protein